LLTAGADSVLGRHGPDVVKASDGKDCVVAAGTATGSSTPSP
jgi:hypothetical protein